MDQLEPLDLMEQMEQMVQPDQLDLKDQLGLLDHRLAQWQLGLLNLLSKPVTQYKHI